VEPLPSRAGGHVSDATVPTATRVLLDADPFLTPDQMWKRRGLWPADWVTHPAADGTGAIVMAFRRRFRLDAAATVRIHVSADERYELWLDSVRVGRGPERGDRLHWCFETYDLSLPPGEHALVACVWWLNEFGPAPFAQISLRPAFLLVAEGPARELLSTHAAPWQAAKLDPGQMIRPKDAAFTGAKLHIDTAPMLAPDGGPAWGPTKHVHFAFGPDYLVDQPPLWVLRPAMLPAMMDVPVRAGVARHVHALDRLTDGEVVVRAAHHQPDEAAGWDRLLQADRPVTIAAGLIRRVIIDLGDYFTAYVDLTVSGGSGSTIRLWWAESLFEPQAARNAYGAARAKGNRDAIEGKSFIGFGNVFEPTGPRHAYSTLWWEAGRYLELVVAAAAEPVTIERLSLRRTGYPLPWTSTFTCSDPSLAEVIPLARRALEACAHETYMDCPYYEQLMYVGDTRLEVLVTHAWCGDDRLPRKALTVFDESRKPPGFTQSRYPSRVQQTIPPFSAWWVAMLHDFMMWRGDRPFVASRLPGVRAVLDAFDGWRTADGLVAGPAGWNFLDWVDGWSWGMPPGGETGVNATLNLQLAWVMRQAAELETFAGEPELADRCRRRAAELADACHAAFWDAGRGLYAEDLPHGQFTEHAQCMAILGDACPAADVDRLVDGLLSATDLARTTVYFSHYLFEAVTKVGRIDRLFDRLQLWFDLKALGLRTTVEQPEPSRSDCHAWGAHPIYHYLAAVLGVRPASPGFGTITIRPQLGPLTWARGSVASPLGRIDVDLSVEHGRLHGTIELPHSLTGTLRLGDAAHRLTSGRQTFG
jgi:alpha-L-rhamnosidase